MTAAAVTNDGSSKGPSKEKLLSAHKGSKGRATRASAEAKSPKRPRRLKSAVMEDPLEYLLDVINDENVPRMRRGAIAKKIAPYFHPKLKPVPPGADAATLASTIIERLTEGDAEDNVESLAGQRAHIRSRLFKDFD